METPTITHVKELKQVLWYVKGINDFGLLYGYSNNFELVSYNNNDWAIDMDYRKSTIYLLHWRHKIHIEFKEAIYSHIINL